MTTQATTNNDWFEAKVKKVIEEAPSVHSYIFTAPHPIYNLAGQRFELRLTAENGYQAARAYSASNPGNGEHSLQLTIMKVPNGEVSPYVVDELKEGDTVEIRGPFGRYFVWEPDEKKPVLLVGGGSGVIPMHAIYAAHQESGSTAPMKLLYSSHTYDDILFKEEFLNMDDVIITLTRKSPEDWKGKTGRLTPELIKEVVDQFSELPLCYVCGMSPFVDAVSDSLQSLGIPATSIRTERFG